MMRLLLLTAFALGLAQARAKVEVVGLHVSKPAYKEDKELAGMDSQNPVRVDLLVVLEEPGIIKIDDKKCKIAKFADDKGTDLLGKNSFGDFWPIGPFPKLSKDQKAVL